MTEMHNTNHDFMGSFEQLTIDTHVLLWYMEGITLNEQQVNLINKAQSTNALFVSAMSIWEISLLASKGRIAFSVGLTDWINNVLAIPGLNVISLSIPILVESCHLPNYQHKDPADRIIIASSRSINSHLMTFDQKIIDYAKQGYLKVLHS